MNVAALAARYDTVALEGSDGTGKSSLARQLADRHGFQVVHSPRTPDAVALTGRYKELLAKPGRLVLDRCFVSELVYGPLYRDGSRLTWAQTLELVDLVTTRRGVLVHLTASPLVIHARLLQRDGTAPPLSEIAELTAAYEQAFHTISSHAEVVTFGPEPDTPCATG
ncbi:hypothetical protein OG429_39955 [Streptomyces sp. NBC_00190]|uniref:hypothetical protein n=1 Tax=unclassified Streptomyces TaxID=2593676 RepID=UPI002E2D0614|nr:hypothetical protein [Streptomyces sp. NBC_00190]WSZ37572.1 hypothetical protein OG239_00920 [Streptomyces sp. NBC_00868]